MKKFVNSATGIIAIISTVFFIGLFIYSIYGLPNKVDNHESRITSLEHDNIELKTKLNMTLQAVYEIRTDVKHIMLKAKLD